MPKRRSFRRSTGNIFWIFATLGGILVIELLWVIVWFALQRTGPWKPLQSDWSLKTAFAVNSAILMAVWSLIFFYFEVIPLPPGFFWTLIEQWRDPPVLKFWLIIAIPIAGCLLGIVLIVKWLWSMLKNRSTRTKGE